MQNARIVAENEMLLNFRLHTISRAAGLRSENSLELPQMDIMHTSEYSVTVVDSTDDKGVH